MSETPLKRFEPNYPKIHNESEMTDLVSKLTGNLQIIFNKHTTISVNTGDTCVSVKGPTSYLFNLPKLWDSVSFSVSGDDPKVKPSSYDVSPAVSEPLDLERIGCLLRSGHELITRATVHSRSYEEA
jgi:hypothetical protein